MWPSGTWLLGASSLCSKIKSHLTWINSRSLKPDLRSRPAICVKCRKNRPMPVCLWLSPRRIRDQNGYKYTQKRRQAAGHRHSDLDTCWGLEAKPIVTGILEGCPEEPGKGSYLWGKLTGHGSSSGTLGGLSRQPSRPGLRSTLEKPTADPRPSTAAGPLQGFLPRIRQGPGM